MEPQLDLYVNSPGIKNLDINDLLIYTNSANEQEIYISNKIIDTILSDIGYIQFYAPWCGHCKHYVPVYTELGKLIQEKKDKNLLLLGAFNCTQSNCNDLLTALNIEGFPTMKFVKITKDTYKGGGKNKGKYRRVELSDYEGNRSIEYLLKYACDKGKICKNIKK